MRLRCVEIDGSPKTTRRPGHSYRSVSTGQPWLLLPSLLRFVTCTNIGYASRPSRATVRPGCRRQGQTTISSGRADTQLTGSVAAPAVGLTAGRQAADVHLAQIVRHEAKAPIHADRRRPELTTLPHAVLDAQGAPEIDVAAALKAAGIVSYSPNLLFVNRGT